MAQAVGVEDEALVARPFVGGLQGFVASDVLGREVGFRANVPDVNVVRSQGRVQRAAAIEVTWMVLVFASSVPTTATFWPANLSAAA